MDIATAIQSWLSDSETITSELEHNREEATKYYLGQPIGGERPGRSNVVMTDVQDVVDWILPNLVEVFCGEKAAVTFLPTSDQDVEDAKIETEYCNWVISTKNDGYEVINNWLQDGLVYKNGYVKLSYRKKTDQRVERYANVDAIQLQTLQQDQNFRIIEAFVKETPAIGPDGYPIELYEVAGERLISEASIVVRNVPPENVRVAREYRRMNLDECPFVAHYEQKTAGDLIAEGYDRDLIESLPSNYGFDNLNTVDTIRNKDVTGSTSYLSRPFYDPATRPLKVWECHVRFDANGDGIPELHRVCYEETTKNILSDEVVDFVNLCAWSPYMVAHRHVGLSVYDKLKEIQKIKTSIMRQMLDNLYIANNPRPVVNETLVNMGDLLSPRIGAPIRAKDVNGVRFDAVPFVAQNGYGMLEYMDKLREERSGVSKQTQGLDPAALRDQSVYGMAALMGAANKKIEYIARTFGETGMKDLMRKIRALAAKYADKNEVFQVAGNKWAQTDPRAWVKQRDMRVLVGVGNVGIDQRDMALRLITQYQEKIIAAQGGATAGAGAAMVDAMNVYNALTDTLENMGIYEESRYFKKPDMQMLEQMVSQPPPPDPAIVIAEKELEVKEKSKLAESQIEMAKHQDQIDIDKENQRIEWAKIALQEKEINAQYKLEDKKLRFEQRGKVDEDTALFDPEINEESPRMMDQFASKIGDALKESAGIQAQAFAQLAAAVSREKEIITDADGRIIGVR